MKSFISVCHSVFDVLTAHYLYATMNGGPFAESQVSVCGGPFAKRRPHAAFLQAKGSMWDDKGAVKQLVRLWLSGWCAGLGIRG